MSILDSNVIKFKSTSGIYSDWNPRTASVGDGVALSVLGYKKIKLIAKVSGVTGKGGYLTFTASKIGILFANRELILVNNKITRDKFTRHEINANGTYIYTLNVADIDSIGIGLNIYASSAISIIMSYELDVIDDEEENSNVDLVNDIPYMSKFFEDDDYVMHTNISTSNLIAALYDNIACRNKSTSLDISYTGVKGNYRNIALNSTNFPNLQVTGTSIQHICIIPFSRNFPLVATSSSLQQDKDHRICVIINNGQVYHNFPARSTSPTTPDGTALAGDEYLFDESVVWELEGRKYPSKTFSDTYYLKNPCLADDSYLMLPILNTDGAFIDTYGNGGFADKITRKTTQGVDKTFVRFYSHAKNVNKMSMKFMGGYEANKKVTFIGTYSGNSSDSTATRICVFATSDGGRQWFCKYEFGQTNLATFYGQFINSTSLTAMNDANLLYLAKRTNVVPSAGTPIPSNKFVIGSDIAVTSISSANPAVAVVASGHGLVNGDVVFFKSRTGTNDNWDWIKNDTATVNSQGTGLFFKVSVSGNNITLYEYIWNPDNNISCRHIHSINVCKDGILTGCGETYPEGWLFYTSLKSADFFAVLQAHDNMTFQRLTSSVNAIQRPLGALLLDDADNNVIFASDNETTTRPTLTTAAGASFSRSSTGLFKGKLSDIDDLTKFTSILESPDVCYFFKEILGIWIYYGQRGHLAISKDKGSSWKHYTTPQLIWGSSRYLGVSKNKEIGIEGMIIRVK